MIDLYNLPPVKATRSALPRDGNDGGSVDLRVYGGRIEWRTSGSLKWRTVIALKDLKGDKGDRGLIGQTGDPGQIGADGLQAPTGAPGKDGSSGIPGVKGDRGDAGTQGLPGAAGKNGIKGTDGKPGLDGREILLQKTATHVQWKYKGEAFWTDLIKLDDLRGPKGDQGDQGDPGQQGKPGLPGTAGSRGAMGMIGQTGPKGDPGDGTGTGTGTATIFKSYQVPLETPDGIRTQFTLPNEYAPGSLMIFLNGINERFISESITNVFTFQDAPLNSDAIFATYAVK